MTRVLILHPHGLGDIAQFSVVLKHLKKHRPDWEVDVVVGRGKHTALVGQCHRVFYDGEQRPNESQYKSVISLGWWENFNHYNDRPNSKVTNCLKEVFGLDWDASLGRYEIRVGEEAFGRAREWLRGIGAIEKDGRFRVVLFHGQGNTSPNRKNLAHWQVKRLIEATVQAGRTPVILDWDSRSPLIDHKTVFNPGPGKGDIWGGFGSGDAETLAALIRLCEAYIGIDSGPGKVASSTDTPALIVWTGHHPLQFHDPAANTTHLIPMNHRSMCPIGGRADMAAFFQEHYQFATYADEHDLVVRANEWLMKALGESVVTAPQATTFLMPNGIGDCMWALLKIRAIAGQKPIDVALSGDPGKEIDERAVPFLRRFPFIRSVRVEDVPVLVDREHPNDDQGRYRYCPDGQRGDWHFLAPNAPLEQGKRIETWLPDVPIDYNVIDAFSWSGTERGVREAEAMGPFCAFYLGPEAGHTNEGHNWGWLWEPKHWVELGGAMKRRGLKVCVVGAKYDRSFWERYVRDGVGEDNQSWEDRIGEFEIGETFAFLKRAKFLISYQCGLAIVLHYMGGRVAAWWRKDGDSMHPHRKLCFADGMKDAWVRPDYAQNYIGMFYRRESVADLVAEIDRRGWAE
jgi:ADP-heptose:LPS heptosyltransferase